MQRFTSHGVSPLIMSSPLTSRVRAISLSVTGLAFCSALCIVACGGNDNDTTPLVQGDGGGAPPTNTFTLAPNTVQADANAARDAIVSDQAISLPALGHEALQNTLTPGTIFYGDRAPGMPDSNPYGFLVRVVSTARVGDRLVVSTTPATLQDLYTEADLGGALAPLEGYGPAPQDFDSDLAWSEVKEGSVPTISIPIKIDLAKVFSGNAGSTAGGAVSLTGGLALGVSANLSYRYENRPGFNLPDARVDFDCNANFSAGICGKVQGTLKGSKSSKDGLSAYDSQQKTVKAESAPVTGRIAVAAGPVVSTLKHESKMVCTITHSQQVGAAYQYDASFGAKGSFGVASNSPFGTVAFGKDNGTHRWEFVLQGGLKLQCGLDIKVSLLFYNTAGLFFRWKPGAELATAGAVKVSGGTSQGGEKPPGASQACADFTAKVDMTGGVEASLLGAGASKEYPLGPGARFTMPFPLRGCAGAASASVDSCAGKADGQYCSAYDTRNAYGCKGGASAASPGSCEEGKYCQSTDGKAGGTAKMDGEKLACDATAPADSSLELSFCPKAPEPKTSR